MGQGGDRWDSQTAKFAVALIPDAPTVRSGEVLGVSVVFTNKTSAELTVNVFAGCAEFDLGAYDRSGVRRDQVVTDCGLEGLCGGGATQLIVEPGGTITKHLRFTARVTRITAKTNCQHVDAGGLPPGKYSLRATPRLNLWLDGRAPSDGHPQVSAPIVVTR
jgi:hypothetical protein